VAALLKTKLPNDGFTGSAGFDVINDENDGFAGSAPPEEGEPKANPPPPPEDGESVAGDFKKLKLSPAGWAAVNPPKPENAFFFSGSSPTFRLRAFRMTRP